ncbi:MAG: primosomal protein N' [Clostridia bacterium]|nr:primosomal protein N' [Clostridia bacterium]
MYATVIVDIANGAVDRGFCYRVPEGLTVALGQHVLVPFGQGSHVKEGFVIELSESSNLPKGVLPKDILSCLEPYPVLLPEQLSLANWMKEAYHCLLVDALRLMIPAQLRGGRIHEKRERIVALSEEAPAFSSKSAIQKDVVALLQKTGQPMAVKDIKAFIPGAAPAVAALLKKGILSEDRFTVYRKPSYGKVTDLKPELTEEQAKVLRDFTQLPGGETALLYGVTGSGKTEVYLRCIEACLNEGKGAIVLVPEIALTPQTVGRFSARFGDKIAVLHSRLTAGERFDEWRRIRLGKAPIVIGARSAIFAPVEHLGLVIIDEEHEQSYQSESTPRYHAMDVARRRIRQQNGRLLLGSATPSLLSYYRAINGSYRLLELQHRVENRPLPSVLIADMREEFLSGNNGIFSSTLLSRLKSTLDNGHQAMLFLNRRGYSTFVSCRACGYVLCCDNCDISMTYHKAQNAVRCHYCGAKKPLPRECPNCHKPFIKQFGVGTEQVEEQINACFPEVKTLRMDADTVTKKEAYEQILSAFSRGEAQILIGTQMIAKGHDFPNVTLVGVIAADTTLNFPDYRSAERTFQLLTQVSGRAGRDKMPGQVILQTYLPEHPVLKFAQRQDYPSFFQYEIAQRKKSLYPPFSLFIRLLLTGKDEEELQLRGKAYAMELEQALYAALTEEGKDDLLLLLAAPAPIARIQGQSRYQILVKLLRTKRLPAALHAVYDFETAHRDDGYLKIETNPQDMF